MRKQLLLAALAVLILLGAGLWWFDPFAWFGPARDNTPPVAAFAVQPAKGPAPLTVTLDAAASTDADGNTLTYAWDFGNGSKGAGVRTTCTYAAPGTFTVQLTVTDTHGASHSVSQSVIVESSTVPLLTAAIEPADGAVVYE